MDNNIFSVSDMNNNIFSVLTKGKKIYITVNGEKCELFFEKGSLLEEKEKLYFDPLYILEQADNKVIKNLNKPQIKMAIFIKSNFFGDNRWHFDDCRTRDLKEELDFSGRYISQREEFYGDKKRKVNITTNGLKVFVSSSFFETKKFSQLSDSEKMQLLRNNGFVEVDLYNISYLDQKTNERITKKVFLTPDFSESDTIDKSIVAIEENQSNVVGKIYETPEQKKKVWEKLKNNSIIVSTKAWVTKCASFKIDRSSLATFLGNILRQDYDLRFEDDLRFKLVINNKFCEKQSNAFSLDYKNGTKEIAVTHDSGISSLCLKVFRGEDEEPIKPFFFLQKDEKGLCIFAGNKKTDIKATEDKSLTLTAWGKKFLNSKWEKELELVSNNSFSFPELSQNKIELATPGEQKPRKINVNENQK